MVKQLPGRTANPSAVSEEGGFDGSARRDGDGTMNEITMKEREVKNWNRTERSYDVNLKGGASTMGNR